MLRLRQASACAALITVVAGCGDDAEQRTSTLTERDQIVATLDSLSEAVNARDADRLCRDIYAFQHSTTTKQCTQVLDRALARSQGRVTIKPITIRRDGARATAVAVTTGLSRARRERQTYHLVKERGSWRVLFE